MWKAGSGLYITNKERVSDAPQMQELRSWTNSYAVSCLLMHVLRVYLCLFLCVSSRLFYVHIPSCGCLQCVCFSPYVCPICAHVSFMCMPPHAHVFRGYVPLWVCPSVNMSLYEYVFSMHGFFCVYVPYFDVWICHSMYMSLRMYVSLWVLSSWVVIRMQSIRSVPTFMSILSPSEYLVDKPRCRMLSTSSRGNYQQVDHSSGFMTRSAPLIIESSRRQTN